MEERLSWETVAHPALLELVRRDPPATPEDVGQWALDHADEALLLAGVVALPVFSDAGAARLSALTKGLIGMGGDAVGSMHRYGTDLHSAAARAQQPHLDAVLRGLQAALEPVVDVLFLGGVPTPASRSATEPWHPQRLHCHSAHAIAYAVEPGRERALRLHVDDSLVTINVCLGDPGFAGADIYFTGAQQLAWAKLAAVQRRQRAFHSPEEELKVTPVPGHALLHFGKHPHRTTPITRGSRCQWVNWYREAAAPAAAPPAVALGAASPVAAAAAEPSPIAAAEAGSGSGTP